jgi:CheY-like chemotaxis protein/HPt (histidine-containing phosphotransfer) domain-containing protein
MELSVLQNKIILIVDDYKINTELLSLFVEDAGAIPLTAFNGKECIDTITKQHVDMILMDTKMPVMNGIDATQTVRSLPQGKDIVIIGISGSNEVEDNEICLKAGMNLVSAKLMLNCQKLKEIGALFFGATTDSQKSHLPAKSSIRQSGFEKPDNKIDQPVMDYDKALKEFENDNDLLSLLIKDFNRIIQSQLLLMQEALLTSDFECIQRESHGIKGGAANLCAMPLSNAATSLEAACKYHAEKEIIESLLGELACTIDSFDEFVKTKQLHNQST